METHNQSLRQPETEDKLRTSHKKLGSKTLEESSEALHLGHTGDNSEATLGVLKVSRLDTSLDNIKRSRDHERSGCTADRGNKVLEPRSRVVILKGIDVLLGESRTTEKSKRARSISGSSPAPSSVQSESFILDDLEEAPTLKGFRVGLTLDLKDVQRKKDDFTNTNQAVKL